MSDPQTIRRGDYLIIAIRCDNEDDAEPCHVDIAFDDVVNNGMKWWLRELAELRGIERKEDRRDP